MSADLIADTGRIDLWCTYISDIGDDTIWPRYDALISEDERARQGRFRFARDRRRYLVTRAMARTVLSRYAAVRPQDWTFSTGPHGRPAISAAQALPPLEFNISHSADVVMLGITSNRALGIDVENVEAREADIDGLDRYFAPEESAGLLSLPASARRRRFFDLWTLKESYIKARGMGLAIPLDHFRFELPGEQGLMLRMKAELDDSPQRWRLWQLPLRPHYLAAICAERGGESPPCLTLREIVPLVSEKIVVPAPSRATG